MSVVCFGELLIDFVALEQGVTVGEASGFIKAPGGAPANVAVAIERLGHESRFIGQVGDDPFGHFLAEVLQSEGVDARGLRFSDKARTALAFVSLREDGERSFSFYRHPSADMLMTPKDVDTDVIEDAQIFHFGSITLIDDPVKSATLSALEIAENNGLFISYDPNLRLALWKSEEAARQGMLSGLAYANLLKVSDEEVEFLTGRQDVSSLWRDNMDVIVVTHGSGGSTLHTRDADPIHMRGFHAHAVDTTGAGDGFVAGMLVGILKHGDDYLNEADSILRFANAVGALTTEQRGAIPSLPLLSQVEAFLKTKTLA